MNDWGTGRYKIKAIYSKNNYYEEGQDSGYIKVSTYFKEDENGTETIEEDIKTRVHNGGFVIYQLTDEELETDPNGAGVIINDINKNEAQSTRNQYIWVPVANVEDIIRTRTGVDGITQFGQSYFFGKTSISKETSQHHKYYKEPRLVESYDIIKYYLQKYSNIDKRENFLKEQQEEFNRMIHSIEKFGGFYIGRYETGDTVDHINNHCFTNPKVVRYNINIEYVSWYSSYDVLKRQTGKTEKYVETGMIYNTLKDYTLKWLKETDTRSYEDICEDSGKWGNFKNNYFKYKESANGTEKIRPENNHFEKKTPTGGITEIIYHGEKFIDSPTSSNNIFDIAGSVKEWTRGREDEYNRRLVSGDYHNSSVYSPVDYFGYSSPSNSYNGFGARSMLLIK